MSGTDAATVVVRGASLAALAASARLAKAGHHVVLDTDGLPDGGHWAAWRHLGVLVDEMPQTFLLPAAWRDLFKKSGRPLDAELARHGLQMVPAPDQEHLFADGTRLVLPTERGAQHHAVAAAFGHDAATDWTALLDELDELWQHLRHVALESPMTTHRPDRTVREQLLASTTLDRLSQRAGAPHLATIVRSQASLSGAVPGQAPALLAVRLAALRRFGSWQLVGDDGLPVHASRLVELLGERLDLRGVERIGDPAALLGTGMPDLSLIAPTSRDDLAAAAVHLDALPHVTTGLAGRQVTRPAMAPTVEHHIIDADPDDQGVREVVDHTAGAPRVTWRRPLGDGRTLLTVHDHTRPRPDVNWGLAASTWKEWTRRPLLGGGPRWEASAASHAGNEPWAELLSAALAVYGIHEHLTGQDIRPTNKEQPRPPRQARPAVTRRPLEG